MCPKRGFHDGKWRKEKTKDDVINITVGMATLRGSKYLGTGH